MGASEKSGDKGVGGGAVGGGGSKTTKDPSAAKKYPLPHGVEEIPPYAFGRTFQPEGLGHPFWHPAPKDLPEPPIHFHKNTVSLELHLGDPRTRLAGMTDAERTWRQKFLMDQRLAPEEPVYIPQYFGNLNPFRRIYRWPWDTLERRILIPAMGYTYGHYFRTTVPKLMMTALGFLWIYYQAKYFHPTWMDRHRIKYLRYNDPLLREEEIREKEPGLMEKGLSNYERKQDFFDLDWKNRYTHLNLDPPLRP